MENPIFKTAPHNGQRVRKGEGDIASHDKSFVAQRHLQLCAPRWMEEEGERGTNRETRSEAGGGPISLLGFLVTLFSAEVSASTFMGPQDYCGVECDVKCDRVLQHNW